MEAANLETGDGKKDKARSAEDSSNILSFSLFLYLNPLFAKGVKNSIVHADMGPVSVQDDAHLLYIEFLKQWGVERQLPVDQRSLWWVLWRTVGYGKVARALFLYLLYSAEQFGPVLILNALVKHFEGTKVLNDVELWIFVALIFILPMLGSIFAAHSNVMVCHIGLQFRNALITMIYRKSLLLSPAARQVSSTGQIVNMFSSDTAQMQRFLQFFNNVMLAPPTIGVCLYLIYVQVGPATFVGLGLMVLTMPMNGVIFGLLGELRKKKSFITDLRVKLMNEILSGVRVIKYYAWESAFQQKVLQVRARELVLLKQIAYIIAVFFTLILQAVPVFMPVLVFYTYVQLGNKLDAATAFTTLSLFNLLQFPFIFLPLGIAQYSQSIVACKRMLDFFDADELAVYVDTAARADGVVISMKDVNMSWILAENVALNESGGNKLNLGDIDKIGQKKVPSKGDTKYAAVPTTTTSAVEGGDVEMALTVDKVEEVDAKSLVNRSVKTLCDANFEIKKGQLVAIVGSVGSGKSSLLSALLGEMHCVSGEVQVHGSVAYCDQRAWILNDTVEGNILFGQPYDEEKFDLALYSANLEDDIKTLEGGLHTQIGERGINLSGGQKARVALARAIYKDADVYLLDDPLSAVDAHVGQFLFHECIRTTLKDKTRLLVTHQVHLLPYCDMVIVLEEGKIRAAGSYNDLKARGIDVEALVPQSKDAGQKEKDDSDAADLNEADSPVPTPPSIRVRTRTGSAISTSDVVTSVPAEGAVVPVQHGTEPVYESVASTTSKTSKDGKARGMSEDAHETASRKEGREKSKADAADRRKDGRESTITTKEEKGSGDVTRATYLYYVRAGGSVLFTLAIVFVLGGQLMTILGSFWLQDWGTANSNAKGRGEELSNARNIYYLNIFAAYSCASLGAYVIRSLILADHRLGTSIKLHENMLASTLHASVAFFDTTPVGRILNRFSSDLLTIDEELSQSISQISNSLASVLGSVGAIAGATKGTFLILMVPLVFFYNAIQRFFRNTNTEIARLESISRSPIYADFSQALNGVNSIRAYKEQQRFIDVLENSVNRNSIANITQQLASNWLAIRLDFIGSTISLFIAVIAASTTGFVPAGFLALGLSYSFQLTTYLKFLVRVVATGEAQMNSVERVMYYMNNIEQEGGGPRELTDESLIPAEWPSKGVIEAKDVTLRYRDGPMVLKGLNFEVKSNEKIGVAGRTGSGKSSMMIGLFRIQEVAGGSITIDGIDIQTVPLNRLRTKLGIIPQDPVMFSASVRFNLDPFNAYSDEQIWDVLQSINLKEHVRSLPNGLNEEVAEGGDNFSAGQRQLICIARAILRKPKILVLDEATASIDNETDALVQRTVREQFKDCTVLTIAHRLNTIIDSDKIMVLDAGVMAEMDTPANLLADKDGLFSALWARHQKSHAGGGHKKH